MDLNSYLAVIRPETSLFAATADEAGLDADVPTTPGWKVSDLVLHMGEVHRWATAAVAARRLRRPPHAETFAALVVVRAQLEDRRVRVAEQNRRVRCDDELRMLAHELVDARHERELPVHG